MVNLTYQSIVEGKYHSVKVSPGGETFEVGEETCERLSPEALGIIAADPIKFKQHLIGLINQNGEIHALAYSEKLDAKDLRRDLCSALMPSKTLLTHIASYLQKSVEQIVGDWINRS